MYFEQFYLGCLSHASYMIGSGGEAAVIDPQRDVDIYLKAASENGLRIAHIFETHLHADFVSGHKELAERTGARIYIGADAGATFTHVAVRDGEEVGFGSCRMRVLHTPGHTLESICLLVTDGDKGPQPWAVLTGDTLFIGDVGRPDLSPTHTPQELASLLYDSLHNKLMTLGDEVLVYPAHGAGSLCGRNLRADRFSTIGTERLTNYALQIASRDEFVKQLTTNLPARPEYFAQDATINREGAAALGELPPLRGLRPQEVSEAQGEGWMVLDTRAADAFAQGHVPGTVNIGLGGQFASWAGAVLGLGARLVIVAESAEKADEARMRLARVGIEQVAGYLEGGVEAWAEAGMPIAGTRRISARELGSRMGEYQVLDVRREPEWQAGHIEGAMWHALDGFSRSLPALAKDAPIAVHCKSGYRSMIAASLLERAGFTNVTDVAGGFDAWHEQHLPEHAAAVKG